MTETKADLGKYLLNVKVQDAVSGADNILEKQLAESGLKNIFLEDDYQTLDKYFADLPGNFVAQFPDSSLRPLLEARELFEPTIKQFDPNVLAKALALRERTHKKRRRHRDRSKGEGGDGETKRRKKKKKRHKEPAQTFEHNVGLG